MRESLVKSQRELGSKKRETKDLRAISVTSHETEQRGAED